MANGFPFKIKLKSGRVLGPLPKKRMIDLILSGVISGDELARAYPKGKWKAFGSIPELAELIPSREALTILNFFNSSQNRMIKKIRKVPGRNIPAADMTPPRILPRTPYSRIDKTPIKELKENTGPGTAWTRANPERNSEEDR